MSTKICFHHILMSSCGERDMDEQPPLLSQVCSEISASDIPSDFTSLISLNQLFSKLFFLFHSYNSFFRSSLTFILVSNSFFQSSLLSLCFFQPAFLKATTTSRDHLLVVTNFYYTFRDAFGLRRALLSLARV